MPRMSLQTRGRAIVMLQCGIILAYVARQLSVHRCTINRLWAKYGQTASLIDRPNEARARVTTRQQEINLGARHLRNRKLPATYTATRVILTYNRPISTAAVLSTQSGHSYASVPQFVAINLKRSWTKRSFHCDGCDGKPIRARNAWYLLE
jgi:hypothetical protein